MNKKPLSDRTQLNCFAAGVFLVCLGIGFWLASIKPVWNDEIYTQINTLERSSFRDIMLLHFEEGNSSPLFYLLQKSITELCRYHFPGSWQGEWKVADLRSQLILRIQPVVFMSLSLALLFWFFGRYYSLVGAGYALLVALSSFMVWAYWAEARPYALWFFLSQAQLLLFLALIKDKNRDPALLSWLTAVQLLLSLTVVFGIFQVLIISGALWLLGERSIKRHSVMTVMPVAICLFCYLISPKYNFFFLNSPMELIGASIPKDRLLILVVYAVFLLLYGIQQKGGWKKIFTKAAIMDGAVCLAVTFLMLLAAVVVLELFKLKETPGKGFSISNRYFTYLTPVGITATALASLSMVRAMADHKFIKWGIIIALVLLLALRAYRTYFLALDIY